MRFKTGYAEYASLSIKSAKTINENIKKKQRKNTQKHTIPKVERNRKVLKKIIKFIVEKLQSCQKNQEIYKNDAIDNENQTYLTRNPRIKRANVVNKFQKRSDKNNKNPALSYPSCVRTRDISLEILARQIKSCCLCRDTPLMPHPLPHEPRPVCILSATAKIAIAGQAPGTRVHQTGIPFNDPSGNRLREWMSITREVFYNPEYFAIVPMGFCFPGYNSKGADLPPRRECALKWHETVFKAMPQIKIVLAIGQYAQRWHIADGGEKTLTQTVKNWQNILQKKQPRGYHVLPLPHPSWRNTAWIKKNPWFENELIPRLKELIVQNIKQEKASEQEK